MLPGYWSSCKKSCQAFYPGADPLDPTRPTSLPCQGQPGNTDLHIPSTLALENAAFSRAGDRSGPQCSGQLALQLPRTSVLYFQDGGTECDICWLLGVPHKGGKSYRRQRLDQIAWSWKVFSIQPSERQHHKWLSSWTLNHLFGLGSNPCSPVISCVALDEFLSLS